MATETGYAAIVCPKLPAHFWTANPSHQHIFGLQIHPILENVLVIYLMLLMIGVEADGE